MSDTRNIELCFTLPADVEAVWKAVSTGEELSRWFAPEVRVKPGKDGTMFVSWGPGMEAEVKIREWKPNEHLRIEFGQNPQTGLELFVDYYVETKAGATTLRLVHSGFSADAEWDEEFESHARGWRIFLHNLRHDLATQRGKACKQHVFKADIALDRGLAWTRVLGPKGVDREGALAGKKTGDRVELTTAAGARLAGTLQVLGTARDLAMTLDDFDGALLRIAFERKMVYGTVVGYGDADSQARAEALAVELGELLPGALAQ
jgi:uncharacterized protein YndB with AHSA1/START domain